MKVLLNMHSLFQRFVSRRGRSSSPRRTRFSFRSESLEQRLAPASLSGVSFADDNGNGIHDAGEAGLAGITVYLDHNNNAAIDAGEATTTTNANGRYSFDGLPAGEYIIRQIGPADKVVTAPTNDGVYYAYTYVPDSGGLMQPARIDPETGQVERFGTPDEFRLHAMIRTNDGEFYGLNGWNPDRFYQLDFETNTPTEIGEIGTDVAWGLAYDTATDTIYGLAEDPVGDPGDPNDDNLLKLVTYDRNTGGVTFFGPGTDQLTATSGIAFDPDRNTIVAFDHADHQFWEFDLEGNPTLLWDTQGLSSWGFAHNGESFVLHARLETNGNPDLNNRLHWLIDPYAQTISEEFFTASEAVPMEALDYFLVREGHMVVVGETSDETDLDFGTASPFGSLSGTIFDDANQNGEQDAGEAGLSGVTVYLDVNDNGQLDAGELTTFTSTDGTYTLSEAPLGDQVVRVNVPSGFEQTSPVEGESRLFAMIVSGGSNDVIELDPQSLAPIGATVYRPTFDSFTTNGLAYGDNVLYLIHSNGLLEEVDPDTGELLDTWNLPNNRLDGAAFIDGLLYVNDPRSDVIYVADPATNSIVETLPFPRASNYASFGALGEFTTSTGETYLLGAVGASNLITFLGTDTLLDPQTQAPYGSITHETTDRKAGLTGFDGEIYVGFDVARRIEVYNESGTKVRSAQLTVQVTGLAGGQVGDTAHRVTVTPGSMQGDLSFGLVRADDAPTEVIDHHIFYNGSRFDGRDPAANAADDNAIAHDKEVLFPGQTATFANYTTWWGGVNGVMIDIYDLPGPLTANDFEFRHGTRDDVSTWQTLAPPLEIAVRPGAGTAGSDRVTITLFGAETRHSWLAVKVKANANTGLAQPHVFYFGNRVGDVNGDTLVDGTDFMLIRANPRNFRNPAGTDNPHDMNRDGRVNGRDAVVIRDQANTSSFGFRLITPGTFKQSSLMVAPPIKDSKEALLSNALLLSIEEASVVLDDDGNRAALLAAAAQATNESAVEELASLIKQDDNEPLIKLN